MQSAAPERSGAAPPGADIVGHVEFVLHHVGIGPNRLIGIAREFVAGEEAGRIAHMVGTGLPRGAVAVSASYFLENLFPACHLGVVDIAYGRNGQSTVPYHEVGILIVGHLDIQIFRVEIIEDSGFHRSVPPFGMFMLRIDGCKIFVESGLNLGVACRIRGPRPGSVEIMVAAVGAGHVGDVPDGVGSGGVLERPTR